MSTNKLCHICQRLHNTRKLQNGRFSINVVMQCNNKLLTVTLLSQCASVKWPCDCEGMYNRYKADLSRSTRSSQSSRTPVVGIAQTTDLIMTTAQPRTSSLEPEPSDVISSEAASGGAGHTSSVNKSHKSSVVIIPPESVWDQIQRIRKQYDKAYERWMPHVNLMYPFIPHTADTGGNTFQQAHAVLCQGLANFEPFKIQFTKDSFHYFRHKKNCTLCLNPLCGNIPREAALSLAGCGSDPSACNSVDMEEVTAGVASASKTEQQDIAPTGSECGDPGQNGRQEAVSDESGWQVAGTKTQKKGKKQSKEEKKRERKANNKSKNADIGVLHADVVNLQNALVQLYPDYNDINVISERGFIPHLSLGQFSAREIDDVIKKFQANWQDIEFEVKEVYMISRADFHDPFHVRYALRLDG